MYIYRYEQGKCKNVYYHLKIHTLHQNAKQILRKSLSLKILHNIKILHFLFKKKL